MEKRIIVIPAYNEEKTAAGVVRGALPAADVVLVVDDGSSDRTGEIARAAGAVVVRHAMNRGLGGALGTGIAGALRLGADLIVTMDADGQHRPEDAQKIFERLAQGDVDFVIGSRLIGSEAAMPLHRRAANRFGNLLTWALFGAWVSDSQSGLRGLNRAAARQVDLKTNGMEVSSEFIKEMKDNAWRFAEVPIPAIYSDYSLSKGQGFLVGLKTAAKLIFRKIIG